MGWGGGTKPENCVAWWVISLPPRSQTTPPPAPHHNHHSQTHSLLSLCPVPLYLSCTFCLFLSRATFAASASSSVTKSLCHSALLPTQLSYFLSSCVCGFSLYLCVPAPFPSIHIPLVLFIPCMLTSPPASIPVPFLKAR